MGRQRCVSTSKQAQRGVYAVEYALVFVLAFGLLYALLCYGLLFTFRYALQNAAEEGARAALRYQPVVSARATEASRIAREKSESWLPSVLVLNVESELQAAAADGQCGTQWATRCSMVVSVSVSNIGAVLPPFPGVALPSVLRAQASVLLEGSAL